MATYNFTSGSPTTLFVRDTSTAFSTSLSSQQGSFLNAYTEQGVTFTFSVTAKAGAPFPNPLTQPVTVNAALPDISVVYSATGTNIYTLTITLDVVPQLGTTGTGTTRTFITGPSYSQNLTQFLDPVVKVGPVTPIGQPGVGTWKISFVGGTSGPKNLSATHGVTGADKQISAIKFTLSGAQGATSFRIMELTTTVNCFCAGTRIATADGAVAVEDLRPGTQIRTADGGATTVRWLGEQPVNTRLSHPAKVNPIRIIAGALGPGLPERDLMLSADHAIAMDGHLITAGALVNGETIYQVRDMPLDGFTYYHVETEAHELLLAEGVAAESFIDYAGTNSFVNADDRSGSTIPEMPLPRISAARMIPERIRALLAERADANGRRAA